MIEKVYNYTSTNQKIIEKIISDAHAAVNHAVLVKGSALPEHYSNSNVYLIVIRGKLSVRLNSQKENIYSKGSIINVPFNVKMNISNRNEDPVEFFIIKAPSPENV